MSSRAAERISEKELKEIYDSLPKARLIEILVDHYKTKCEINDQIPFKVNELVEPLM